MIISFNPFSLDNPLIVCAYNSSRCCDYNFFLSVEEPDDTEDMQRVYGESLSDIFIIISEFFFSTRAFGLLFNELPTEYEGCLSSKSSELRSSFSLWALSMTRT